MGNCTPLINKFFIKKIINHSNKVAKKNKQAREDADVSKNWENASYIPNKVSNE